MQRVHVILAPEPVEDRKLAEGKDRSPAWWGQATWPGLPPEPEAGLDRPQPTRARAEQLQMEQTHRPASLMS